MRLSKQKFLLICSLFFVVFSFTAAPHPAQARGLVPCGGYNADGSLEKPCTVLDVFVLIARVTNWLIAAAGLFAVYEMVNNGFWLVISMGNEEDITRRKNGLTSAVVGLVLVLMAFMLINTVVNLIIVGNLVKNDPRCRLDLTNPTTYLNINTRPASCSGQ